MIVNLISALRTLKTSYGSGFVLTMAPETFFVQLGYQFYGGTRWRRQPGRFLPAGHPRACATTLTVLHVQDYNSGPIMGLDNQYHNIGNADFHIAMTDMLAAGFPSRTPGRRSPACARTRSRSGCRPRSAPATGTPRPLPFSRRWTAWSKGTELRRLHAARRRLADLRGLMTWSINWDRYYNWEFQNCHEPYLNAMP